MLPPPLESARDTIPAILHLILTLTTLLLLPPLLLIESRLLPSNPHLLSDGEASTPLASQNLSSHPDAALYNPPPILSKKPSLPSAPRRAHLLHLIFRILLTLVLLAATALPTIATLRHHKTPFLTSLAPPQPTAWLHTLLRRSLLEIPTPSPVPGATPSPLPYYKLPTARIGLSHRVYLPSALPPVRRRWSAVHLFVAIVCILAALFSLPADWVPVIKPIPVIFFIQALLALVIVIPAVLIFPTKLPSDTAHLTNSWLDRVFKEQPRFVNETRLLGNWFLRVPGKDVINVLELPGFRDAFCRQFRANVPITGSEVSTGPTTAAPTTTTATGTTVVTTTLAGQPRPSTPAEPPRTDEPSTTAVTTPPPNDRPQLPEELRQVETSTPTPSPSLRPESPESIPLPDLPRSMHGQLFLAHLVGKPVGEDVFGNLGHLFLPVMAIAPVAVAQAGNSYLLYPFFGLWAGLWGLIVLVGLPGALRPVLVGTKAAQIFEVCGVRYRVLVLDSDTVRLGRVEIAAFAIVVVVGFLQSFRWIGLARRRVKKLEEEEVKTVQYEEVYSRSGSLRW